MKLATLAALFALAVVTGVRADHHSVQRSLLWHLLPYTTPSIQGSYFAGANPCLVGVGGGAAGGPVGLSFTFGKNDEGCTRRSDAAAWHALGRDDVAIARMCQDTDNRKAFEAVGYVCPQDQRKTVALAVPATAIVPVAPSGAASPSLPTPAVVRNTECGRESNYRNTCG